MIWKYYFLSFATMDLAFIAGYVALTALEKPGGTVLLVLLCIAPLFQLIRLSLMLSVIMKADKKERTHGET